MNKSSLTLAITAIALFASGGVVADETETISSGSDFAAKSAWRGVDLNQVPPLPFYDEEGDPAFVPLSEEAPDGEPGQTAPGAPGNARDMNGMTDVLDEFGDEAEFGTDFGTANVYTSFPGWKEKWANKTYPWRAVGKLYFTTPSGGSSCSASVIGRKDAIVTAAHCCHGRSAGWYGNFMFAPGLDNTTRPYGTFGYRAATVLTAWITSGGRQNDVCVLTMATGLSSKTGWLGRSWNWPSTENVFTVGYPSNKDGGARQNICASENYPNCGSSLVNATGCDKTYGDSGAPWIRKILSGNWVNSVTSGWDSCTGAFGQSYNGAKFTSSNIVTLCTVRGCD
jgi:V8-like Glu-specific endopeptidase